MASLKFPLEILAVFVIISVILLPIAQSHSSSPAPAPTSDGINLRINLSLEPILFLKPYLGGQEIDIDLFFFWQEHR